MFRSLRQRLPVAALAMTLPWLTWAGLTAAAPQWLANHGIVLALVALGCLLNLLVLFWMFLPVQQALQQARQQLQNSPVDSAHWSWRPTRWDDLEEVLSPLQDWHRAMQSLDKANSANHTELQEHQARMAVLHQVLQRMHIEGMAPDQAIDLLAPDWREDRALTELLELLVAGHTRLVHSITAMTVVVERNSTTLAELSWQAKNISEAMNMLAVSGTQAASGSQALSDNSTRVSQQASQVGTMARQAEENSRQGQHELQQTVASMRTMGAHTQEVSTSISRLQDSSRKIEHIARLIREIADKINLLSLNAAIEAARAGEHGRGFAVVAQEVNNLAEKTFNATQEIDASINGILQETDQAVKSIHILLTDVQDNVQHIDQVGQRLSGILEFSSVLTQQMDGIVEASEQSARQVQGISGYLGDIRNELHSFGERVQAQETQIIGLTELGEGFFDNLVELRFETTHRRMYKVARAAADAIENIFEQAIAKGQIQKDQLLSDDYQVIPDTNPPKYSARFDAFCDRVLPAVQEQVLADNPALIFAISTDKRGYVPTHNNKFAKPPTGDYNTDLVHSRSKRIFNDRTGSRCGSHTKKMLLQTYKRDTGEIMHDLSVPIFVDGVHWGGFRMGYQAH